MTMRFRSISAAAALAFIAAPSASAQARCDPARAIARVDHVPVAVRDLDAAARDFAAMGFSFKPGRPHPNSILNQHVKFRDGTEVELITATEPRDDLARYYVDFLRGGEGGAFAAFDGAADSVFRAIRALEPGAQLEPGSYADGAGFPAGHPLRYLFFIRYRERPVDLPEQVTHANTAARLRAVWLRTPDRRREQRMLERLGGCTSRARLLDAPVREVRLGSTSVYLLPGRGRRMVAGVTLEVADLSTTMRTVGAPVRARVLGRDARGRWMRVRPERAHGIWLEFLQPAER